jgi:hypothetical protein
MSNRLHVSTRGLSMAAVAISCLALFAALGGPSYAKRLLGAGDIGKGAVRSKQVKDNNLTGRDVRNNSLKGADVDEATLDLTGQKGDPGEKGDKGDPGARGPSNTYGSTVARVNDLSVSPTYTVVDTLAVPAAGNHVVNAKLRASYSDLAIRCELGTVAGGDFVAHDEALNIPDGSKADSAVTLALQAAISTTGAPPTFGLRCRKSTGPGTGVVSLHFISVTAIEVGAIQAGL